MRIINPAVKEQLEAKSPLSLDLGCGRYPREGYFGVDCVELPHVDIVADLNQPLTLLPDSSCARICTRHALEHMHDFVPLLREMHRVLVPDGELDVTVPHFSNPYSYSDPTHVRFFGLYSFQYFADPKDQPRRKVHAYYTDLRFRVTYVRVEFYRDTLFDRLTGGAMERLANLGNRTQEIWERRLCWLFPAWQIRYILRPVK